MNNKQYYGMLTAFFVGLGVLSTDLLNKIILMGLALIWLLATGLEVNREMRQLQEDMNNLETLKKRIQNLHFLKVLKGKKNDHDKQKKN